MVSEKKRLRLFLFAVLFTLCISFIPGFHIQGLFNVEKTVWMDIVEHAVYFFCLTLFLIYINNGDKRWAIWVLVITLTILIEIGQMMIAEYFSWHDVFTNIGGITAAILLWPLIRKKKPKKRRNYSTLKKR